MPTVLVRSTYPQLPEDQSARLHRKSLQDDTYLHLISNLLYCYATLQRFSPSTSLRRQRNGAPSAVFCLRLKDTIQCDMTAVQQEAPHVQTKYNTTPTYATQGEAAVCALHRPLGPNPPSIPVSGIVKRLSGLLDARRESG